MDDFLFTAPLKVPINSSNLQAISTIPTTTALARVYADLLKELQPDLILTGVQAHNDLDGSIGPLLAEYLGLPYVGYVAGLTITER